MSRVLYLTSLALWLCGFGLGVAWRAGRRAAQGSRYVGFADRIKRSALGISVLIPTGAYIAWSEGEPVYRAVIESLGAAAGVTLWLGTEAASTAHDRWLKKREA